MNQTLAFFGRRGFFIILNDHLQQERPVPEALHNRLRQLMLQYAVVVGMPEVVQTFITGDAAPYVDSNWRTMVPIRALAESFDAEVVWNQDEETVTINFDGDTQIVMTVGEQAYTVNGEEATMDTEPVNTGSRVYVPIRFVAEGIGFHVLPLYNADGLTASVVFQR